MTDDDPAPVAPAPDDASDPVARAAEALEARIVEHESVRADPDFQAATTYTSSLVQDFVWAVQAASLYFTRYPENGKWLIQASIDDLIESAIAIFALGRHGIFNVGRRELRYMIESVVKAVYVDESVDGSVPLPERIAVAGDNSRVPRSSVEVLDGLPLRMLPNRDLFTSAVKSSFGKLSGYVHISKPQLDERVRRVERGEFIGFESATTLRAFNELARQVFDLILVLVFEGVGPSFTGDLFVHLFDPRPEWKYHKGRFVSEVSTYFDYKSERQSRNT